MSKIIDIPRQLMEPGLNRILADIAWRIYITPGLDSLSAMRLEEQIYVAGGYAHSYLEHIGFSPELVQYVDIARLNAYAVAGFVGAGLDHEALAGIERTMAQLTARARVLIDPPIAA